MTSKTQTQTTAFAFVETGPDQVFKVEFDTTTGEVVSQFGVDSFGEETETPVTVKAVCPTCGGTEFFSAFEGAKGEETEVCRCQSCKSEVKAADVDFGFVPDFEGPAEF